MALPGNPVSSYVSFELFVRPAIRTLMGLPDVARPSVRATLKADEALGSPAGRRQFLRGTYDPESGTVSPVGGSGSHLIAALAHADSLIVVPEDVTSAEPGPSSKWSCSAEARPVRVACCTTQALAGPGAGAARTYGSVFPGGDPRHP